MNELRIFNNADFGDVRTVEHEDAIWFVGKDVAEALGYSNPQKALRDHVKDSHKTVNDSFTVNGTQPILIDEAGLYSLVMRSKLPQAEAFQEWVVSEVLPSIRKTGSYSRPSKQPAKTEQQEQRAKAMLLNAQSRQCKLWLQLADKTDLPEYKHICQQKAAEALAGTQVLPMQEAAQKTYSATEVGNLLGITAHKVGALANKFALKSETYGKYFYDKSAYSNKQVETFRYYQNAIEKLKELLEGGAAK